MPQRKKPDRWIAGQPPANRTGSRLLRLDDPGRDRQSRDLAVLVHVDRAIHRSDLGLSPPKPRAGEPARPSARPHPDGRRVGEPELDPRPRHDRGFAQELRTFCTTAQRFRSPESPGFEMESVTTRVSNRESARNQANPRCSRRRRSRRHTAQRLARRGRRTSSSTWSSLSCSVVFSISSAASCIGSTFVPRFRTLAEIASSFFRVRGARGKSRRSVQARRTRGSSRQRTCRTVAGCACSPPAWTDTGGR
jgi:hypothetical protein